MVGNVENHPEIVCTLRKLKNPLLKAGDFAKTGNLRWKAPENSTKVQQERKLGKYTFVSFAAGKIATGQQQARAANFENISSR